VAEQGDHVGVVDGRPGVDPGGRAGPAAIAVAARSSRDRSELAGELWVLMPSAAATDEPLGLRALSRPAGERDGSNISSPNGRADRSVPGVELWDSNHDRCLHMILVPFPIVTAVAVSCR
jgi:hypothetical protein